MSQGNRPCHNFLKGQCKFGKKCKFSHDPSAKHRSTSSSSKQGGHGGSGSARHHVARFSKNLVTLSQPLDANFPSSTIIASKTSDGLLQPVKYYTDLNGARSALRGIVNEHGRRFDTVTSAEKLVLVINSINQVNLANEQWSTDEPDALLAEIAKTPGEVLALLGQILSWPKVGATSNGQDEMSFKGCYMGVIGFLTSSVVLNSLAKEQVNALYGVLENNLEAFIKIATANITACMKAGSFKDSGSYIIGQKVVDIKTGLQIFRPIVFLIAEYICRWQSAAESHPDLLDFVQFLADSYERWAALVLKSAFDDALCSRETFTKERTIELTRGEIVKIRGIIEKNSPRVQQPAAPAARDTGISPAVMAMIDSEMEGPGDLRPQGPRHDNDYVDMRKIRVAPTGDELLCQHTPYTPVNLQQAQHHLEAESVEKMLDIQFRLLRIDTMSTLSAGVQAVVEDLERGAARQSQVHAMINAGGGIYVAPSSNGSDRIMMPMMSHIQFNDFTLDHNNGLVIQAIGDVPPGPGRKGTVGDKKRYWEQAKRLQYGTLVAVITHQAGMGVSVSLAILTNFAKDFKHIPKGNDKYPKIQFGLSFIDPVERRRLVRSVNQRTKPNVTRIMLESPIMFESVRPFLESLQKIEPLRLPFAEYLTKADLRGMPIELPEYSLAPGFKWDLSSVLKPGADAPQAMMDPSDPASIERARRMLYRHGKLDPSQVDAVLDCLTRRVGLIQGPPGTGKTFTCVEIIRLLIANNVGDVVLIAFTNHALDHILQAVHEQGVTDKFARLGSRCNNEVVEKFLLAGFEKMMKGNKASYNKTLWETSQIFDDTRDRLGQLKGVSGIRKPGLRDLGPYLKEAHPTIARSLDNPPAFQRMLFDHIDGEGWEHVGEESNSSRSLWPFWQRGTDIDHLRVLDQGPKVKGKAAIGLTNRFAQLEMDASSAADDASQSPSDSSSTASHDSFDTESSRQPGSTSASSDPGAVLYDKHAFLRHFKLQQLPAEPKTTRDSDTLLRDADIWSFSKTERRVLADYIWDDLTEMVQDEAFEKVDRIVREHDAARRTHSRAKDARRQCVLRTMRLVGATTTLASKMIEVLKSFQPKILIVEEAGQVLEAHILATLVPSIQHVIAIGDPLQLRPPVNTWELDVDSKRGSQLYRFNVSLMERLSNQGLPMSQLEVQRRMRPEISSLARNTLYPNLQDHEIVKDAEKYPKLRGVMNNVFFFDHQVQEGKGGEDRRSKHNDYEAQMACDLALHFLKQGTYNEAGDIIILCAYSGQLQKCRELLRDKKIAVKVDERDLASMGIVDADVEMVKEVSLDRQVYLRTIDNFQGEEAKIVIVSTVRNAGDLSQLTSSKPPSIGFMQFNNRINVALTRAKHGMYIFGNAEQLSMRSEMWKSVIGQLIGRGDIGQHLLIVCLRHPDTTSHISQPGEIAQVSPDGGCLRACDDVLPCAHECPLKCHPDKVDHLRVQCRKRCARLLTACGHPCPKECYEKCGPCRVPVKDHGLPCGHIANVTCGEVTSGLPIRCPKLVMKQFLTCEHSIAMACGDDISTRKCQHMCGKPRDCCNRTCTAHCCDCQRLNLDPNTITASAEAAVPVIRTKHTPHRCESDHQVCGHQCGGICSREHTHGDCQQACLQQCDHRKCDKACSVQCAPCKGACKWACKHGQKCSMPCGMPCDRLPCDRPCDNTLKCGHPCPSVCGEPCDDQVCSTCAPEEKRGQVVDFIMQTTLHDALIEEPDLRTIALDCGHVFTVETLDGVVGMQSFYAQAADGTYKSLRRPDGFQKRPVCPTCRGPITSPRYSRAVKRSLLDIQEQIALQKFAKGLAAKQAAMSEIDAEKIVEAVPALLEPVKTLTEADGDDDEDGKEPRLKIMPAGTGGVKGCTNPIMFREQVELYFGIDPVLATIWRKVNSPLLNAYRDFARMVNGQKLPHVEAYEAAITSVYWREVEAIKKRQLVKNDPSSTQLDDTDPAVHERAMKLARLQVSTAPPGAESQYRIEALLETIKIRLQLVPVGRAFEKRLGMKANNILLGQQRSCWISAKEQFHQLVGELLRTCQEDLETAGNMCERTEAWRAALHVELLDLQVKFDLAKHEAEEALEGGPGKAIRDAVAERAEIALHDAWEGLLRGTGMVQARSGTERIDEMVREAIMPAAELLEEEWKGYIGYLQGGDRMLPVSLEEKMQVAKAIVDSHWGVGGRFYQCPNGHSYVVGDCGQAMVESQCPECGARIGGSHHNLLSTNTRDQEMEELGRLGGAGPNPHVGR